MLRPSTVRPAFCHVTWQRHGGRAREFALALDGTAVHVYPAWLAGRSRVPARYLLSVVLTVVALLRLRPTAVAVVNPPVVPGLIVAAYCRLTGARFLLDSHTSSFGVKGNAVAARSLGITRFLARRSAGVMVTTTSWVAEVQGWGAHGLVVHEAPPALGLAPAVRRGRPQVLFVGVFSGDEPVEQVVAAAALMPEADVLITGDVDRAPAGLVEGAGPTVVFTGFLDQQAYRSRLEAADVVIALTTEPTSVMRAAYEAVYARRGLVVSDWPALREVFPRAHHRSNDAAAIADGVRAALAEDPAAAALRADDAATTQNARWDDQLHAMRTALDLPAPILQGA